MLPESYEDADGSLSTVTTHHVGGDGYHWLECMTRGRVWSPIAEWGAQGHNLGSWPLVIVCVSYIDHDLRTALYEEGDETWKRWPNVFTMYAYLDTIAEQYWRANPDEAPDGLSDCPPGDLPEIMRGPFLTEARARLSDGRYEAARAKFAAMREQQTNPKEQ